MADIQKYMQTHGRTINIFWFVLRSRGKHEGADSNPRLRVGARFYIS
jgi:hypothetical protein